MSILQKNPQFNTQLEGYSTKHGFGRNWKNEKFRKSKQICEYADDIVVIVRNLTAVIEALLTLAIEGRKWA